MSFLEARKSTQRFSPKTSYSATLLEPGFFMPQTDKNTFLFAGIRKLIFADAAGLLLQDNCFGNDGK